MKTLLLTILYGTLIPAIIWSQSLNRRGSSYTAEENQVTIINQIDPNCAFFFSAIDKTDYWKDIDYIKKDISLSAESPYLELQQNLSFFPQPIFWCRNGMQYLIRGVDKKTHTALMGASDKIADNEIRFFSAMADSLNLRIGDLERFSQIKDLVNRGIYSLKCKEMFDNKLAYLEEYQKAHSTSRLFTELCKTSFYADYINGLFFEIKREPSRADSLKKVMLAAHPQIQNDELLFSFQYRLFCQAYNDFLAQNKYQRDSISLSERYNNVKENFTGKIRDYLLFSIIHAAPNDKQVGILLPDFYNDCNDEAYRSYIRENIATKAGTSIPVKDLLFTTKLDKVSLQQIIDQNKGKLIYVDFWASWCSPCRAMMKESKLLHEKFKDKVAFIYISIDKDFSAWKKASKEEALQDKSSFCISSEAEFIKKHAFKSIPRYVLFDKDGGIVTDNAPRPNSVNELGKLFGKL
ncbi:MAG: TlpA disulfide reductase family protein [Bacteroidota bacterium]|nr:TlpA disulfide reductase family protein [Bacteroidota bacterium]